VYLRNLTSSECSQIWQQTRFTGRDICEFAIFSPHDGRGLKMPRPCNKCSVYQTFSPIPHPSGKVWLSTALVFHREMLVMCLNKGRSASPMASTHWYRLCVCWSTGVDWWNDCVSNNGGRSHGRHWSLCYWRCRRRASRRSNVYVQHQIKRSSDVLRPICINHHHILRIRCHFPGEHDVLANSHWLGISGPGILRAECPS